MRPAKIATSGKWVKGKLFSQRHPTLPMPIYTAHTRAALPHHASGASVLARCRCCWAAPLAVGRPWHRALCCQARQQSPSTFASGLSERNRLSTRFPPQPPTAFLPGAEVSSRVLYSPYTYLPFPQSPPSTPNPRTVNRSISFSGYRFDSYLSSGLITHHRVPCP